MSLPTRERELKFKKIEKYKLIHKVAPHTGAWIEILLILLNCLIVVVAPHTGAWIEIASFLLNNFLKNRRSPHGSVNWNYKNLAAKDITQESLPTRERELKFQYTWLSQMYLTVAPHTGAWIEIDRYRNRADILNVAPHTGAWIEICSRILL